MGYNEKTLGRFFLLVLTILLCVGLYFYIYLPIQAFIGLGQGLNEVVDKIEASRKIKKNNRELFGRRVYEISEEYFFKLKTELGENRKIQPSAIKKIDEGILIPTKRKRLIFKDINRSDCMGCVRIHEIIGENKEVGKLIIETGHFRFERYQMVDLETGGIDTLFGEPFFSENNKYLVTHDFNSKDSLAGGVNIYSLYENRIFPISHRGEKWFPVEMFWQGDENIFAKVEMLENSNFEDTDFRYIRIKI